MAGRFARTFSFLYGGGVPFINALELTADALGSRYMKKRLCQVMEEVKNGMLLSDSWLRFVNYARNSYTAFT